MHTHTQNSLTHFLYPLVLQGATGLRVQQEPKELQVTRGSQVTLACQVIQSQAWERLRVEWTKDGVSLCEPHITNGSLSLRVCGPRRQLSWKLPGNLTLRLERVSLNDSGHYVCGVAVEIPKLEVERGNGTQLLVKKGMGASGGEKWALGTDRILRL